ncbi:MAG: hypothetical protein LDL50_03715 [Chloroflexi bacterium]|nr:hypothetical protein [Chloroflexota bacterium]MCA2001590.1 hypothetical protein [Chloroflexota bacterium]
MRGVRTLIFVFLIIVIAAVVGFLAYRQYIAPPPAAEQAPSYVEVYITAQPIPQGGKITADLLTTMQLPPENVIEVMYTLGEEGALLERYAKYPLDQGVVLTTAMVSESSSAVSIPGPSWASLISPGMTAISIPTNRFSLSGYAINNGAHVNLIACFLFADVDPAFQTILPNKTATLTGTGFMPESTIPIISLGVAAQDSSQGRLELDPSLQQPYYLLPSEVQRPRLSCQMLLQDVVVMKVGNFSREAEATIDTPAVPPTDAEGNPVPAAPPDIATLIVNPQDAITLTYLLNLQQTNPDNFAITQTRLTMTLRNPNDQSRQAPESATLQFLLSQYNIQVPAKLPYALQPPLYNLTSPLESALTP